MQVPALSVSRRTRKTPFSSRVQASGVKGYTVYNHMLLPTVFESVEAGLPPPEIPCSALGCVL